MDIAKLRSQRRGRFRVWVPSRIGEVVATLVVAVALLAAVAVMASAAGAEGVSVDAAVRHQAEVVLERAAVVRGHLGESVLAVATGSEGAKSVASASTSLDELSAGVLVLANRSRDPEELRNAASGYIEASRAILADVVAGNATPAVAGLEASSEAFAALSSAAVAERERRVHAIANANRYADRVGLAGRVVMFVLIPMVGLYFIYRALGRRQATMAEHAAEESRLELQKRKNEFIEAVAQHLRQPVRSVGGFTRRLREGRSAYNAAQRNELIEVLADEAADLSDLIDDLVAASEAREQALLITAAPCDLRRLVESVALGFGPEVKAAMTVEGDQRAWADPMRTRQIVRNLMANAVDRGSGHIQVAIDARSKRVTVRVADDAPLLPEDIDVFAPYPDLPDGQLASGLGVGLALSLALATRMDGSLTYGHLGNKNVFELTLPMTSLEPKKVASPRLAGKISTADVAAVVLARPPRMAFLPIFDLDTYDGEKARVAGFEALSRFSHGSPPEWFRAAAEAGLRYDLEITAVREAVAQFAKVPGDPFLSVNVSTETLMSSMLVEAVKPLQASRVVFELSEEAAVANYQTTREVVARLQSHGYRLALDDVGAGEMDLWDLFRLRPDIIKLDVALTREMDREPARVAMVEAINVFAHRLGATVIAEGIEETSELRTLMGLDIELGQGYLLGEAAEVGTSEFKAYEAMLSLDALSRYTS